MVLSGPLGYICPFTMGVFFVNVKMTIMAVPKMKTTSGNDFSVYFRRFWITTFYEKILKTEKVTSIVPILYGE